MNNEESSESDSNNTYTNGTAVTDYLEGNPRNGQHGPQENARAKVTQRKSIKEPTRQRAPFRISIQQLDAYLGLVIAIIACVLTSALANNVSYGFIIPIAVILSFAINIAAPRAQSAIADIITKWEKGCANSSAKAYKRLNGPVLPMTNTNDHGASRQPPLLAPTLLGEWVRSTANVGRPKTVKINTCSSSARQAPNETAVKFIENRPFVHGTLAACYTTDMLVDFGASTSVISRTAIAEIESKLGTTLPRKHSDMHIRSYGGHSIPAEGTVIMTLEIGNKTFNTPFTITPYETATKVILGTTSVSYTHLTLPTIYSV